MRKVVRLVKIFVAESGGQRSEEMVEKWKCMGGGRGSNGCGFAEKLSISGNSNAGTTSAV